MVTKKSPNSQLPTPNSPGFTLIELMVTISIIAILATVAMVAFSTVQKTARVSKRVQDLKALRTAIELYKSSTGIYPIYNTGTGACISTSLTGLVPTYMPALPADSSGGANCYWYFSDTTGNEYKIRTKTDEMSANDYNTQAALIDPFRDGNNANDPAPDCVLDTLAASTTPSSAYSWAYYTNKGCAF